ncbi:MAG TPA: CHAT domain-containing protein [Pyrinomonadaceae bacterium]|nr:CHAT domain-containing protein [Pyrinomonadaceae bacterium]
MTFTSQPKRSLIALFVLSCLLIWLPVNARAQNDDQAAVRRVVEQLFAALQREDLAGVMALWSEKSPDLNANRESMQQTFANYRSVEVKSLNLNKITIEADTAIVQLIAELNVLKEQAGASATSLQARRTIQMTRENGTWKVWRYTTAEEELAAALTATKTPEEGAALLAAQPELMTTDLVNALVKQVKQLSSPAKSVQAMLVCDLLMGVAQRITDKKGIAVALLLKGDIYRGRGDYKQAKEQYDQSLKLADEIGDKVTLADVFSSLGTNYMRQGNYPPALDFLQRALRLREELGDKVTVARELRNVGNIYLLQGDNLKALEILQRSLKLSDELGNKASSSATLLSIGIIYYSQGNYPQALEYFQQSLKIKREIGDQAGVARALSNIGSIYGLQGEYVQSLNYLQQTLKIREELGDKPGTLEVLHNIGVTYFLQGDYAKAISYDQRVLKLAEEMGNSHLLASIFQNFADCYLRLGQYEAALENADRAAALATQSGAPGILGTARTAAGSAHLALNQPEQARQDFLEAIVTIERLRGQVVGGEQERQLFFENKIAPYQGMIDLSLSQNNPAQALSYAERAKGRVLLDVLSSGRAEVTKAMTSNELERDRALAAQITSLNTQLAGLKQSKPTEAQLTEITAQLDKARLEYEAFQVSLYAAHPELKVKRGQTPLLTFDEVAALLPNRQTAILEYVVTEDKTYLFVLRKAVPTDARNKTPIELTVHTINIKSKELSELSEAFHQNVAERNLTVKTPARKLYDLLVKPAEGELHDVRRLCIVPDGALWNLPFQALHQGTRGYLLEQYALFYAPSLSVLREMGRRAEALSAAHHLRSAATRRTAPQPAGSKNAQPVLLALGNPKLSGETIAKVHIVRRDEPLSPLPDAEKEVNFLGRLYGPDNSRVLIGEQAQEATVKAEAGKYEVLHFASHAVLDDRNPLYSRIILSRAEGDAHEDGLLEAWEIMKLDLDAELAILSACQTARGRVAAGEGVIGMSWALFVAGSPAAIVSQWKVDSARSAELMIEFHRNLRQKQRDSRLTYTRSESLRRASLKLLHSRYNHPAYWAAFILIGADR